MANNLKREKAELVLKCLVDGASVRATERITGVHRDTALRLMGRVAKGCAKIHEERVRNLPCKRIQCDEIWAYVGKKERQMVEGVDSPSLKGDFWTFVAVDADTKLIPAYLVGKRDRMTADAFIADLASRLSNRVQLSTDALRAYVEAMEFGFDGQVDYGQVVKSYEANPAGEGRYSPPRVVSVEKKVVTGNPAPEFISTSYIERQNLTMRMNMRRFTRLTNAFSKKADNLRAAVAMHFTHYNFVRTHQTIGTCPAVAAGLIEKPWTIGDLLDAQVR